MFLCEFLERGAAQKLKLVGRTATTDAERGKPSMIESSPNDIAGAQKGENAFAAGT